MREVLVPVIVTDQSGQYTADLNRGDFSVSENGKPQKIIAFSRPTASAPARQAMQSSAVAQAGIRAPQVGSESPMRTYLICLDPLHMAFKHFAQVRQALQQFFAHEQPGDSQYVLVSLGRELHVLVDSTRDPGVILSGITSQSLLRTIQDSEATNIATETDRFARLVTGWCGACTCTSAERDVDRLMCPGLKGQVKAALVGFSERMFALDRNFLQELMQSVNAMASMPTKRTVLFISDGFNRFPGEELYTILRNSNVGDSSLEFNPHDLQPQLNAVLRLAVRYDIRFYTIDSRGLYTGADVAGTGEDASSRGTSQQVAREEMGVAWLNSDAMAQLARQTGGQFFENSNDLSRGIRRTFDDGHGEYVLAYVPSKEKLDGKFRRITVKVKRKDLHVAAKSGYWASS